MFPIWNKEEDVLVDSAFDKVTLPGLYKEGMELYEQKMNQFKQDIIVQLSKIKD